MWENMVAKKIVIFLPKSVDKQFKVQYNKDKIKEREEKQMTMIMDYLNTATILFFILQFINVVLSTMKTVLTVKANTHVAMLINTITYTFYSGVVKLMTGQDMVVVLAVTFLTNVIGVYIAMFILEKAKKDVLWKIEVTVPREEMEDILTDARAIDIPFNYVDIEKYVLLNFYSATQEMSADLKEMLKKHNVKYFVIESKNLQEKG